MDNELANLTLGSSEALVVNGNVKDFLIEGNRVHDTNNIAIDVIGFEGTAPDPTVDQARRRRSCAATRCGTSTATATPPTATTAAPTASTWTAAGTS